MGLLACAPIAAASCGFLPQGLTRGPHFARVTLPHAAARRPAPPADGAMAVLYARLVLPASGALIATMAATTLLSGQRMCARVLESSGVEEPLAALHGMLGLGL